jgi:hypothetical protein
MSLAVRYQELDPGPVVRDHLAWDGIAVVEVPHAITDGVDVQHPA